MVEYLPFSPKDQMRSHQFGKKVLAGIFLCYELVAGGNLQRRDLCSKNQRERSIDQTKKKCFFLICRWYSKIVRKRPRLPRTHSKAGTICRESEDLNGELHGEPGESQPTEHTDDAEARADSSQRTSSSTERPEGRNVLHSTEIHWCDKVYFYGSGRHGRDTYWWLLECPFEQKFVSFLERIHKFHIIRRETSKGTYVVRRDTDKDSSNYQTRPCMARRVDENWQCRSESRKTRMGKRKTKARQCSKTERNLLYRSRCTKSTEKFSKSRGETGKTYGRRHAV